MSSAIIVRTELGRCDNRVCTHVYVYKLTGPVYILYLYDRCQFVRADDISAFLTSIS